MKHLTESLLATLSCIHAETHLGPVALIQINI